MSIAKRLGLGYAVIAVVCLIFVAWLGYHEFVSEPAEFAARGLTDLHKDTRAELATVLFLGLVPVLLGLGWWWMHRALAPLRALTEALGKVDGHTLPPPLPRGRNRDEIDRLTAVFNLMTGRLEESLQRIHEFTLRASHELKTPLTVMRAQLETALREGATLTPQQSDWLGSQLDEVIRLGKLVDALGLLTKLDAGQVVLGRHPVPLGELVQEAFEDAVILAQPMKISVSLEAGPDLLVAGDRDRLRQLLLILMDNAVKHNRPGGSIRLALEQLDDFAVLQVTNSAAPGAAVLPARLFEPFVRGEEARNRSDGCGLGLTIARGLVEAHGGTIELVAESAGTITARVRLPRLKPEQGTVRTGRARRGPDALGAGTGVNWVAGRVSGK